MTTLQWKKYLASAALITMTFTSAGIAMAAPERHDMQEMHTKAQKIMDEHHKATDNTMKELLVKKAELKGEMGSMNPDTSKIESLSKEIGALKGKLLVDRVKMDQDFVKEGLPPHRGMPMEGPDEDCNGMHNDKMGKMNKMNKTGKMNKMNKTGKMNNMDKMDNMDNMKKM